MASYHCSIDPVSRADGRSATACAAYRAGDCIVDRTTGQTFDYSRKGGVLSAEIVLPTACAKLDVNWARDRQELWNRAEEAERRKDARVARDYEITLPHELAEVQRKDLAMTFAQELADKYGVAVDVAFHKPHRDGDQRNDHAHLLTTTRQITPTGLGGKASIEWSDGDRRKAGLGKGSDEYTRIRARWAELTNERLREFGHSDRVDHRTLKAQGIDRAPQRHKGPSITAIERQGKQSEVVQRWSVEDGREAERRLTAAAEQGRAQREVQQLAKSILDVSGDLAAAIRERDALVAQAGQEHDTGKGQSAAERFRSLADKSAERWADDRAKERAAENSERSGSGLTDRKGDTMERTPDKEIGLDRDRDKTRDRGRDDGFER